MDETARAILLRKAGTYSRPHRFHRHGRFGMLVVISQTASDERLIFSRKFGLPRLKLSFQ
jgi:hypothetical protein